MITSLLLLFSYIALMKKNSKQFNGSRPGHFIFTWNILLTFLGMSVVCDCVCMCLCVCVCVCDCVCVTLCEMIVFFSLSLSLWKCVFVCVCVWHCVRVCCKKKKKDKFLVWSRISQLHAEIFWLLVEKGLMTKSRLRLMFQKIKKNQKLHQIKLLLTILNFLGM